MGRPPSPVALANEHASILIACRVAGLDLPEHFAQLRSPKVHCPFGVLYHSDGGAAAAMRIYPESNSAWCFSCSYYYTPVGLVARACDLGVRAAAELLLDRIGYRPPDPSSVWLEVVGHDTPPDRVLLAEALKTFCRRVDADWSVRQFEQPFARTLRSCLQLLDLVGTDEEALLWLGRCKTVMSHLLQSAQICILQNRNSNADRRL